MTQHVGINEHVTWVQWSAVHLLKHIHHAKAALEIAELELEENDAAFKQNCQGIKSVLCM